MEIIGIIRTDWWLEDYFEQPHKMITKLSKYFSGIPERNIHQLLVEKGLYQPNRYTKQDFTLLKEKQVWHTVKRFMKKYQKEWAGPDIPIFIFPIRNDLFRKSNKNGFSFPDKIFLFLPGNISNSELEALVVHEYHHVCRMKKINKLVTENTLLDSLIMEGLAEHAVLMYCGEKWVSRWNHEYSIEQLDYFWKTHYQTNQQIKLTEPLHDQYLYGKKWSKPMLGYAIGYYLIDCYRKKHKDFSIKNTLSMPADFFIDEPPINEGGS